MKNVVWPPCWTSSCERILVFPGVPPIHATPTHSVYVRSSLYVYAFYGLKRRCV